MKVEKLRKVYPGDSINEIGFKCIGIQNNKSTVLGTLYKVEDLYFVKSATNAYSPKKFDIVIGKVVNNSQDYYRIDLGSCTGILPALSFMNASKRNKPDLEKDDLVMCQIDRVVDGEPLLTCKSEDLGKIDECFAVDSWKIRLFYFNDFIKKISVDKTFKISLAINGFVLIDGTPEVKREILKLIEDFQGQK